MRTLVKQVGLRGPRLRLTASVLLLAVAGLSLVVLVPEGRADPDRVPSSFDTGSRMVTHTNLAGGRYCANLNRNGFVAIRIERSLPCRVARRLVGLTMSDGGYFRNRTYYCRWGSGGYPGKTINGKLFFFGFCENRKTGEGFGFFGRLRG